MGKFASSSLRSDRDLVSAAVKQDGLALQYAAHDLRADRGIVTSAISSEPLAFAFALPPLDYDVRLAQKVAFALDDYQEAYGEQSDDEDSAHGDEQQLAEDDITVGVYRESYSLVGDWDDWGSFMPLLPVTPSSRLFSADLPVKKHCPVQFQVVESRSWNRRYFPCFTCSDEHELVSMGARWRIAVGPSPGQLAHGINWNVENTMGCAGVLRIYWQPDIAKAMSWDFMTRKQARKDNPATTFGKLATDGAFSDQDSASSDELDELSDDSAELSGDGVRSKLLP